MLTATKLRAFPNDIPYDATSVHLDDNSLVVLSAVSPALRHLSVQRNRLTCVSGLGDAARLVSLTLSHNRIGHLAGLPESPELSSTLVELELSNNLLRSSNLSGLRGLRALQTLDLSHNSLDAMDIVGTLGMESLQQLNLAHNRISVLEGIETLKALERFGLGHNRVTRVSLKPGVRWRALKTLDLVQNDFRRVHTFLRQCELLLNCVQSLDTSGNPMHLRCGSIDGTTASAHGTDEANTMLAARRLSYRSAIMNAAGAQLRVLDGEDITDSSVS